MRRTETAVVVVVGRVQAAAALLVHRAPGCRDRDARCQQGGHAKVLTTQHAPFAFLGRVKTRTDLCQCSGDFSLFLFNQTVR